MSFLSFWFGKKKPDLSVVDENKVAKALEVPTPSPIKTYTFAFKYEVEYNSDTVKDGTPKYCWTSGFNLDYQKALADSRQIIKDIVTEVNRALEANVEHVFIIDASIKTKDYIKATATDVVLIEFHNGIAARVMDIEVPNGKDFILTLTSTEAELCKMLAEGVFKIMKPSINW